MEWLVTVFLIVGLLAFITQALLKLFVEDSSCEGTLAWKWKNILSIVAGVCLYVLLGFVILWRFSQGQNGRSVIQGIAIVLGGGGIIWISTSELLQLNSSPKRTTYLVIRHLLSIAAGLCIFASFGLVNLWRFFQGQNGSHVIEGIVAVVASISVIWINTSELLQLNQARKG